MDSYSALTLKRMDRAAASRQKSCNACVRGKRKCDKRTPKCTRCAAKGLECVYQRTPPGASSSQQPDAGVAAGVSDIPDFDMSFDIESLGPNTTTTPDSLHTDIHLQLDPQLDFSIMDLINESTADGSQLWNLADYSSKMDMPVVPRQPIRDLALYNEVEECMAFNPLDVYDNRTRIGYIVDYISNMHRAFAQTRTLPFLHPRLYGSSLPRPILSAFCACTAYTSRTAQNKGWVMKLIADTAKDIHREGERADTPMEKLARVQALVILDTIRLFDGDVALRATADRESAQLISWAESLTQVRRELESGIALTVPARERPPKTWEDWILLESIKRTVLISCSFICLSAMLKTIEPPADIFNSDHSFTASRHLWEADSSVNFYRAWQEKPQYNILDMEFKDFWAFGRPEDVDEFTRLMLTAQAGPDAMDHFMTGPTIIPTA